MGINNVFSDTPPFVALDPRNPRVKELFDKAFSPGYNFAGVKIYPSLGYLPTHPVLMLRPTGSRYSKNMAVMKGHFRGMKTDFMSDIGTAAFHKIARVNPRRFLGV